MSRRPRHYRAASGRSARDLAAALRDGALTAVALTEACLARIEALEPDVHAWAFLDRDLALAQARERRRTARRRASRSARSTACRSA